MSKADVFHKGQLNTNKPRESVVVGDESDSNFVIKMPTAERTEYITEWLKKQRHARMTVNFLLENPKRLGGYFVPKITDIENSVKAPYVREQRATGRALDGDYFNSLPAEVKEKIYQALARFVYDMNHCRPLQTLQQKLANGFDENLANINLYIDKNDKMAVQNAYNFFQSHPEMTSSLVFFHGDMNENNMFYDAATDTVSFLDFAESTYETLEYVFYHDLIKLPWVDPDKIIKYYSELSKNDNIHIKSNPAMLKLYDALNNLKWTGESLMKVSGDKTVFKRILHENIKQITNAYGTVVASMQQNTRIL